MLSIQDQFFIGVRENYINPVKAIIQQATPEQLDITADDNFAIRTASLNGHLEVVKYLIEVASNHNQNPVDITADDNFAIRWASYYGHLNVVKYLVEEAPKHGQKPVDITADDNFAIRSVSLNNRELARYLVEVAPNHNQKPVDITKINKLEIATTWGNLDLLRYLYEEAPLITGDIPPHQECLEIKLQNSATEYLLQKNEECQQIRELLQGLSKEERIELLKLRLKGPGGGAPKGRRV